MLKRSLYLFLIFLLTVFPFVKGFSFGVLSEGELGVHNLDSGLSYASIQAAIWANETLDGHTISVDAGVYRENVIVVKSVSLVAEEGFRVVVDGGRKGTIFSVLADQVNITGFVIQNSGMETHYYGILIDQSNRCVIRNNIVRDSYYGLHLYYAHDSFLLNNTFSNCSVGVWLAYSERNVLLNNSAFDNEHEGFSLYPSSHNVLRGNKAWDNKHGVYNYFSQNNTMVENWVSSNNFGIWFSGSVNNAVWGNEFYNNTKGLRLAASSSNSIAEGNFFEENDFGISLGTNSSDNFVFHNMFLNNTRQIESVGSVNFFDNDVEGNYWIDYDGSDEDNDGIGDVPYVIDENNTDRHPLMGWFSGLSAVVEKEEYKFHVVSNCSVSGFEFLMEVQTLKFRVSGSDGAACFCRVLFPRLVLTVPYMVAVDGVEVDAALLPVSNFSHVFLYFVFNMSSHEVVVASRPFYTLSSAYNDLLADYDKLWDSYSSLNASYSDLLSNYADLQSSLDSLQNAYDETVRALMYGFLAATAVGVVVSLVSLRFGFRYYRRFREQRRIIEAYGVSPLDVARALFELDVRKRGEKIERFEEKYGVKIRPRGSLEDIIESLKSRKKRGKQG